MPTARRGFAPHAVIPGLPVVLVDTAFDVNEAGELVHYTEGKVRATVPPEGWDDYAREWPMCAELVAELRGKLPTNQGDTTTTEGGTDGPQT